MKKLIKRQKSIIVAADVPDAQALRKLVKNTHRVRGIGGYKVGLELVLAHGLPKLVSIIRKYTSLPIIYDQQKAATDIPEMGKRFAHACQSAGVNSVILFPFGGAETEISWIKACQKAKLITIVGAHMTQPRFLASQGGFIANSPPTPGPELDVLFEELIEDDDETGKAVMRRILEELQSTHRIRRVK